MLVDPLVDRDLGQRRRRERRRGREHERGEHRRDAPLIRRQQLGEAAELAPASAGLLQPPSDLEPGDAHSPATSAGLRVKKT